MTVIPVILMKRTALKEDPTKSEDCWEKNRRKISLINQSYQGIKEGPGLIQRLE